MAVVFPYLCHRYTYADMTPQELIRRCHDFAGAGDDVLLDADSLIGLFQSFRPDGEKIVGLFDELANSDPLHERLQRLYSVAGEDRRPQGGRDAYFIVRRPRPLDPDLRARACPVVVARCPRDRSGRR